MTLTKYNAAGEQMLNESGFAPQAVVCSVGLTGQVGVTSNWAKIPFDTKVADPYGYWDGANYRFQPRVPGYYRVGAELYGYQLTAGGYIGMAVYKNGNQYRVLHGVGYVTNSDYNMPSGTTLVYLNGMADYVEIWAFCTTPASAKWGYATAYTWADFELVAASVGVAPEPWHTVGNSGEPALQNSCTGYGGTYGTTLQFRKLPDGTVCLRGLALCPSGLPNYGGSLTTGTIFTLPAGYRPLAQELMSTQSNGGAQRLDIMPTGQVVNGGVAISSGGWVALTPLSFVAEQ